MPTSVKAYVHRIGRTARGGKSGMALSLVSLEDLEVLSAILAFQKRRAEARGLGAQINLIQME